MILNSFPHVQTELPSLIYLFLHIYLWMPLLLLTPYMQTSFVDIHILPHSMMAAS